MKRDVSSPSVGKHTNEIIDGLYHKVNVDGRHYTVLAQRLAYHRADRQIGYIVIVHDIEMDNVSTGGQDRVDLFPKAGKVCGKY
jgi:hypothetical protein